jgi:hypothetical protein
MLIKNSKTEENTTCSQGHSTKGGGVERGLKGHVQSPISSLANHCSGMEDSKQNTSLIHEMIESKDALVSKRELLNWQCGKKVVHKRQRLKDSHKNTSSSSHKLSMPYK